MIHVILFSVLVVRASSNFMQIYEPYANEGIPRLIAHKMEAFAGTSPILLCPGFLSVFAGVSNSAFLTQFPDQQPSLPLASSSSNRFSVVISQCLMDSASLICKSCVRLVSQETTESRGDHSIQPIFIWNHWTPTQLPP